MFSFFGDNPTQTQKICDAIIKIFASPIQSPKNFYLNNPDLKQYYEILEPPTYKQKQLLEIAKDKSLRPFELEIILGTELDLNSPITNKLSEIFSSYQLNQSAYLSGRDFIFQFAERILVKINFQFKYLVNKLNSSPNTNNRLLFETKNLLEFFVRNSDNMNQTFFDILSSFLGHINKQWETIFFNGSVALRNFAESIFSISTKILPYEPQSSFWTFSFIRDTFSQSFRNYSDFNFTPQLLNEFQKPLIYILDKLNLQQKEIVNQMTMGLLQEAPTFLTEFADALLVLKNCVLIYKNCLDSIDESQVISSFQAIIEYFVWTLMKFPESSQLSEISNLIFPKISFSNIDAESYKKMTIALPEKVKSVLNPKFDNILSNLSEIINSNNETKSAILKDTRDYLIKCQPSNSWERFPPQLIIADERNIDQDDTQSDSSNESYENESRDDDQNERSGSTEQNKGKKDTEDLQEISSEYYHFRALLCFFIEITKRLDTETVFNFYFGDFDHFQKDWSSLFLTYVYPNSGFLIDHLFFNSYKNIVEGRKVILDEIAYLIDHRNIENREISVLAFVPLINSLFLEINDFGSSFVSSQLLKSLIRESKKNNRIFLLLSSIIYKYPIECFASSPLTNFLTDSFDDRSFHKAFVKCLINGLKYCGQMKDSQEIRQLLNHLTALLPSLLAKKYKKSYHLIDIMEQTIPSFENENISIFFQVRILDLISDCCKNDPSEKMLRSAFRFFIALSRTGHQNLLRMSNPKSSIFSTFSEIFEKNNFDFDIVDVLFDFAIIPNDSPSLNYFKNKDAVIHLTFVNPMAITLIFKWIEGRDNESEIVHKIYMMGYIHIINAFQLQNSNIPTLILDRISKINNKIELVRTYLDLLYSIWRQGISISDAYSAISTMKLIQFPHLIIDLFFRLLNQEKKEHNIFYWLNGNNSGFSGTKISFDKSIDTLFISFQIFIDEMTETDTALVFISNDKGDTIEFGIRESKIYFEYNNANRTYFKSEILLNVWHNISFVINSKRIRLILCEKTQDTKSIQINKKKTRFNKTSEEIPIPDNLFDSEVFSCPYFFNQSIDLFIGRRKDNERFFRGLIGTIFVFNDLISYNEYLQLNKLHLLNYTLPHLIAIYVPRIVEDCDTIRISKELTAEFHGLTLTSFQTMHNVIASTNFFDCLLPFFSKMISCKYCADSDEICAKCGRLNKENGRNLLVSLTSIINIFLKNEAIYRVNKSPNTIIEILSQYFIKIDTMFFTENFINNFDHLFQIAQSENEFESEAGQKMVEEIWLNYEMISRFPPELQLKYFSVNLMKTFTKDSARNKLFNSFTSYDFLINKLLLFYTKNDENVTKIAWQITLECLLKNSLTTATASALLGLSFSPETALVSETILNFIILLEKTSNSSMNSVLQIFNSLLPFVIWASRPPLESQRKAMNYIFDHVKQHSPEELKTALMQIAFLYEPPNLSDSLFQIVLRHFQNGCSDAYPLLIRIITNFTKNEFETNLKAINDIISPNKHSKIPLYSYWVLTLAEYCMNNKLSNINFSQIFGQFILIEFLNEKYDALEKLRCLMLLYGAEENIDFSELITNILEYLFLHCEKNKEKSLEIIGHIFGCFFVHIFFKYNFALNEPDNNFLDKYADHICTFSHKPQISFEFISSIQSSFNLDILEKFISYLPKKDFEVSLSGNFMMECQQLIAYTLLKLCENGSKLDNTIKTFIKNAKGNKNAINIIRNYSCSHTDKLKGDDPQQFLSAFELSFSLITPQINRSIESQLSVVSSEIINYLTTTMETNLNSKVFLNDSYHRILYFLQSIETGSSQKLLNIYKKYRQNMNTKFNNKNISNMRKLTAFLRELHIFSGPWFDSSCRLHYKIENRICIDGSRALMKVDTKYDFAKNIASIEDQIKPIEQTEMNGDFIPAKLLTIKSDYIGAIQTLDDRLVFEGDFAHKKKRKIDILCSDILYVFQRILPNGTEGIEIFITGIKSFLFEIPKAGKDKLCDFIDSFHNQTNYFNHIYANKYNFFKELSKATGKKVQRVSLSELYELSGIFNAWNTRQITTYSYIFYLNIISGRSINCLMIYPVFPWVISDYTSDEIDLENPNVYRDFSIPTFLLNDKQVKYQKSPKANKSSSSPHFSNPFIVCEFLKRVEPFGTIKSFLNNKYKEEINFPKCFDSIEETWKSVTNDIFDNRELTPEFFTNEFIFDESFISDPSPNLSSVYISTTSISQPVSPVDSFSCFQITNSKTPTNSFLNELKDDEEYDPDNSEQKSNIQLDIESIQESYIECFEKVRLPPWSKGEPSTFIKINRAALESEHTRHTIHNWIDIMFGIKSHLFVDKVNMSLTDQYPFDLDALSNDETYGTFYTSKNKLSSNPDLIVQAYPEFCYKKLNNLSGRYGICPQQVIMELVKESNNQFSSLIKKIQISASKIFRLRKSYALQSDFKVINFMSGSAAKVQPIQNLKFFEVSEENKMLFMGSPYELYVKAVVFNKSNNNSLPSELKSRKRSNTSRKSNDSLNIDLNVDNVSSNISIDSSQNELDSSNENKNKEISINEFENVKEIIINHEAAPISSIAVVKNVLVTATSDGTIRRWILPKFLSHLKTNFHYCSVISIGGCLSLNLLISIDTFGNVVLESLMNTKFSLCIKLRKIYPTNFIHVFKSGRITIIQSNSSESNITVFNMKGLVENERKINQSIQEFDTVSKSVFDEKLIVGYNSDTVEIIDVSSLNTNEKYKGLIPNMKFCCVKNSYEGIYAFTGSKIEFLSFKDSNK